ncbi:MAG: sugar phosphate isomerase/epimerase [Spirochaetaceae bacterium]|jgi:sugar phosphate isomerase/epimerase|nr:sugar phosphate isomerase/epimerase [Spirochaetaceae bacterium]
MKLGVLTVPLYDRSVEEAFRFLSERGVELVEIGTGGSPGKTHCDPETLLSDEAKLNEFTDLLKKYHLGISALSCHSNHVHPDQAVRDTAARDFTLTLRLAEKLGIDTVVTFSGCPGDQKGARYPNWVTCAWPDDYQEILKYQWEEELIPFWRGAVREAADHGVKKIALEMHPGFSVYNPASLLRLRTAVGSAIGANLDPSHLFWQGISPVEAIKTLRGAIYHFHAKDTKIDRRNTSVNGLLDPAKFSELAGRSWVFRTVGYGHDTGEWKEIISALALAGYDGAVSIEHEDAYMSIEEGIDKAIRFLRDLIIRDDPGSAWWF